MFAISVWVIGGMFALLVAGSFFGDSSGKKVKKMDARKGVSRSNSNYMWE
jgi:hypothetical protein